MATISSAAFGTEMWPRSGQARPVRRRWPTWNTYIWVDNADEAAAKVRAAGGGVVADPFDVMDSGRMAVLTDPEGAAFCVWQAKNHRGAKVVNEHGSLNFNGLATRDPEAAKAFYGAVFGWTTLDLPFGVLWTLSGYGDHLEERSPGLRQQMAQMGAPDGLSTSSRPSPRSPMRMTRRRTGVSPSGSTTLTRRSTRPANSAARS